MALTDEQRSMLQLLLGGQSYDDIGSLLGVGSDEVRLRARAALQEIAGADPDAHVAISDYLLGQADPIGRADAVRHLQADPEANALASRLVPQLRLLAPQADLPDIPAPRGGRRAAASATAAPVTPPAEAPTAPAPTTRAPTPPAPPAPPPGDSLRTRAAGHLSGMDSKRRSQLFVGLGALLILLVVGGLALAGSFGGDEEGGSPDCETIDAATAQQAGLPAIQLEPAAGVPAEEGCEPTGQVVFSQAGEGENAQLVLQTNLANLAPTPEGETYIIWLFASEQLAFPLAQDTAGPEGNLSGAAAIPPQLLPLLGNFNAVNISLASSSEAEAAIGQAGQQQQLPRYVGETILSGALPNLGQQGQGGGGGGGQGGGGQGDGGGEGQGGGGQ